jgi:hypothetical protein
VSAFVINPYQFGFAPFKIGLNFRATSAYVTDGADETYVLGTDAYPTTRDGATFGWESGFASANTRNRNTSPDQRIAGVHFDTNGDAVFRIDLPSAGTYSVGLAAGDASPNAVGGFIKDDVTTKITITNASLSSLGGSGAVDATDTWYSRTNWPTNNSTVSVVFSSSICRFEFSGTGTLCLQHLFLERTA